jgi:hypothetical protein
LSAAVCPCRSATTQCSTRIRSPEIGSGQRACRRPRRYRARFFHEFIDAHAFVDCEPGLFGKRKARAHANADDHQVGVEHAAALERYVLAVDCGDTVLEMEFDAMLFVQSADEIAELRPEHALEGAFFRRDHVYLDVTGAQRGRSLQSDETRADHDRALCVFRLRDDSATIGQRAQRVHMLLAGAGNIELDRLGACRQQQLVKPQRSAV